MAEDFVFGKMFFKYIQGLGKAEVESDVEVQLGSIRIEQEIRHSKICF